MLEYNVFSLNNNDNDDGKDNIITATERMKAADKASDAIKQEITTMIGQWNTTFVFVTNLPRIEQKNTQTIGTRQVKISGGRRYTASFVKL